MKQVYFSAAEYASVAGCNERSVRRMAEKRGWQRTDKSRLRDGNTGRPQYEYHFTLFDDDVQARLLVNHGSPVNKNEKQASSTALWHAFDKAPSKQKEIAETRVHILDAIHQLMQVGDITETLATNHIAQQNDVSVASIWNWKSLIKGIDRADWMAALLPAYKATAQRADVHPEAWDFIVSDWLRPEKPAFTACYRRLVKHAKAENWKPIPHERSLRRRLTDEVPRAVKVLAREGKDKARLLMPAQRRTVVGMHAMQAVNMDGHTFDVFVNWEGHTSPIRPTLVMLQDVYSRKIVAWRLSDSENQETVRLTIGDLVENFGIPDQIVLDNGSAFASKWITGKLPNRFRYKVKQGDPTGILTALGVGVHWAKPARGQSKPIERSFGDLEENISRHPLCAGAYTGNSPMNKPANYGTRSVDQVIFAELVEQEINAHNARQGRRTEMANGRSLDDAFNESFDTCIPTWASASQKALWLLAADKVRAQKGSGVINFYGNRYWSIELNALAGQNVIVRFDPDHLHQSLRVYDVNDAFVCNAELKEDSGFFSKTEARATARDEKALLKNIKEEKRLIAKMDAASLGRMMQANKLEEPTKTPPKSPKVMRLATPKRARGNAAVAPVFEDETDEKSDVETSFSKGLRVVFGGLDE